jgi:hypothetical protein
MGGCRGGSAWKNQLELAVKKKSPRRYTPRESAPRERANPKSMPATERTPQESTRREDHFN